jgi:predicted RNA binding protein with dsRBD fold (UPF0201 family)
MARERSDKLADGISKLILEIEFWKSKSYDAEEQEGRMEGEIDKLHNVIRDEWPPDQAEEIINNCKK